MTDDTIAAFQKEFLVNLPSFQKDFLNGLPTVLEKARVDGGVPGMSVAIMHKGKLVFAQGFGKRNREDPFTEKTVSHIASVSKAFTATAIGELVAEGKVDWDTTPVSHYLPEFQLKDPILTSQLTLADLLSHRTPIPSLDFTWFRNPLSTRELIKQLKHLELPSSKLSPFVNYNNAMYAVAGEAAANVAGMSYADLIKTKIFEPLGLKDAGLSMVEMAKQPNYAMPYDTVSLEDAKNGVIFEGYMDEIPMADAPAGDIFMNVVDLVKWGNVIMKEGELDGKQVLNKDSVQDTLTPRNIIMIPTRRPNFAPMVAYGFGWVLDSYMGHACVQHIVAVLANIMTTDLPSSLPYFIADGLLKVPKNEDWIGDASVERTKNTYDLVAKVAYNDLPKRIKDKPHSHDLADYVGEYTHPVQGKFSITLQEDGSGLQMRIRTIRAKLEHWHYDSFRGFAHDFAMKAFLVFNFKTGSNGSVDAIETVVTYGGEPEIFKKMVIPMPEKEAAAVAKEE
ncbi:hypothetical protein BGX24_000858 [Mortierella sp. AD032]|nr:hypothetical protein BGX24_000858 [Mortierella sp. AD032]